MADPAADAADAAVCQCGHYSTAHRTAPGKPLSVCNWSGCPCTAFVADVNRPDDRCADHVNGPVRYSICRRCGDTLPLCETCGADLYGHQPCNEEQVTIAAVPDREGATEQLAEERIQADFAKHPGSWRKDPEGWFREGWIAGYNAAKEDAR